MMQPPQVSQAYPYPTASVVVDAQGTTAGQAAPLLVHTSRSSEP